MPRCAGVRMILPCETMQSRVGTRPPDVSLVDAWFGLNYRLQEEAIDTQINKAFVEQWMKRLCAIVSPLPQCFWLFLARINELALLCASRYVDCCEFAAARGFLAEPSSVLVHVEGGGTAVSRERARFDWLGQESLPAEEEAGPLLPCLYGLLKGSGYLTEEYLGSVSRRAEKIDRVAGMLAGLGMCNPEDISMKLSCMGLHERKRFRSRLCLFDRKIFNELGRALHLFMLSGNADDPYVCKYLRG